jgi:lipopolysaccharide export LptBFGC system permease protein LptF
MGDSNGNLLCSPIYDEKTEIIKSPVIFVREKANDLHYRSVSQIRADYATYEGDQRWRLNNGIVMIKPEDPLMQQSIEKPIEFFETDLTPRDIPIRRQENFMDMLSSAQLSSLIDQGPKIKDLAQLYAQKHDRITTHLMNIIMLMVSLPILICRDPKNMKSAVMISFGVTTLCFVITFGCRMLAGEIGLLRPELWTWLPVLIFVPVALIELDSMQT